VKLSRPSRLSETVMRVFRKSREITDGPKAVCFS
jgi:hypothetical protein